MKSLFMGALVLCATLLFTGCATTDMGVVAVQKTADVPAPGVAALIKKFNLEVVDFDYNKAAIGNGTRSGAKALLIDARPAALYVK